jgi:hypothetical protein
MGVDVNLMEIPLINLYLSFTWASPPPPLIFVRLAEVPTSNL